MDSHGFMLNLIVYMTAAVITVPLFARFGLGSVLGYLVAGIIIGPWGLSLIGNVEDILHFSELGVVLLLFIIGLELEPAKLWAMRKPILGAGGTQMLASAALICAALTLFGFNLNTAAVIGLGLALSSTAISLQLMNERNLMRTPLGETGFSILLFQDISVIPIVAVIPLLVGQSQGAHGAEGGASALVIVAVIVAIFIIGRYALRHIFRFVASTHLPEIFTALSLLLVCGLAVLMNEIGVSMALGAFLGGVILADSEYRLALESDIEPFKGLLLGLFFISVGMTIDFGLLFNHPLLVIGLTIALVATKAAILYGVAILNGIVGNQRILFSFVLSQSGEFAFVIFGFAVSAGAIAAQTADKLTLIVAMSMVITPILMVFYNRIIEPRELKTDDRPMDQIDEDNPVILVGFGRFGQVVGRMLYAHKITPTVIDHDPDTIERVRRFGYKTYYGDVIRHDVLEAIGAEKASLIILTGEGSESINQAVTMIQKNYPNLKIIARAKDRPHAMQLIDQGVDEVSRETFYSAVDMGKKTLKHLGYSKKHIERIAKTYIRHDVETLYNQVEIRHDEKALISHTISARQQLEETLQADRDEAEDGAPETSS